MLFTAKDFGPGILELDGISRKTVEEHLKLYNGYVNKSNEIMDKLFTPRMQPAVRKYLTELRTQAFLEIKPGYVDTGAAEGKDTAWTDPAQLRPETVSKQEVEMEFRKKRLLWMVPVPGTSTGDAKTSSSR